MTQSKHTPGPWKRNSEGSIWARSPLNAQVRIAEVRQHNRMNGIYAEANAYLIAAAPDLLSALEAILFQVNQGKVFERDACIAAARAAVSKARGE